MRSTLTFLACLVLVVSASSASADHMAGHNRPAAPAAQHFPAGFEAPADSEWGWPLGGFGGAATERTDRTPVVFVHGNNTDHATWFLVADRMVKEHGYGTGDLWALSYNGVGCTNDGALFHPNTGYNGWTYQQDRSASTGCVVTANDVNVPDLTAFIDSVVAYTGAEKIHIVSHSLGVTVARKALFAHPELLQLVDGFVGIAGANHGTTFCPPGSGGVVHSCDEIAADTAWLEELNADESPGPTRWMTVYDGTGAGDPAFVGPTYAQSPRLEGALNRQFPFEYHNDLRVSPEIVDEYVAFLLAPSHPERAGSRPHPPERARAGRL